MAQVKIYVHFLYILLNFEFLYTSFIRFSQKDNSDKTGREIL